MTAAERRLESYARVADRLTREDRAALRKYVERDMAEVSR